MPTGSVTSRGDDKGQYRPAEHPKSNARETAERAGCSLLLLLSALTFTKLPLLRSGPSPGAEASAQCLAGVSAAHLGSQEALCTCKCCFFPHQRQRHHLGFAPHSWSDLDAPSPAGESMGSTVTPLTALGTAPQRCSRGAHTGLCFIPSVHLL